MYYWQDTTLFPFSIQIEIDRTAGAVLIHIPALIPKIDITQMPGATHAKIIVAAAEFDWDQQKARSANTETAEIHLNNPIATTLALNLSLPVPSTKTIVVAIGTCFYQEVNGKLYKLSNRSLNAMAIVGVDNP